MKSDIHRTLNDSIFKYLFETYQMPKGSITHEAHLRIAWIYLTELGFEKASQKAKYIFNMYSQHFGDGSKYHETITVAYMKLINNRLLVEKYNSWIILLSENPELLRSVEEFLLPYYSKKLLYSEKARKEFVEPDLKPF